MIEAVLGVVYIDTSGNLKIYKAPSLAKVRSLGLGGNGVKKGSSDLASEGRAKGSYEKRKGKVSGMDRKGG